MSVLYDEDSFAADLIVFFLVSVMILRDLITAIVK